MAKSLTLYLSLIFIPSLGYSQAKIDCKSQVIRDSLLQIYSQKAWKFGYNHPYWTESWDSLIAICPDIAEAYREKAIPFLKSGDYARAFELENKAVELDPKSWMAYRGFLHCIFTKNYEMALADFDAAEKLTPGASLMDHTFSFFEGLSHMGLANLPMAEQAFIRDMKQQQKAKGNDVHFNTLLYLGIVRYEMKKFEQAEKDLKDCLSAYEHHPEANYYLAMTLKAVGNPDAAAYFDKARQYYQQGYKINEDNEAYVNYPRQISLAEIERR